MDSFPNLKSSSLLAGWRDSNFRRSVAFSEQTVLAHLGRDVVQVYTRTYSDDDRDRMVVMYSLADLVTLLVGIHGCKVHSSFVSSLTEITVDLE